MFDSIKLRMAQGDPVVHDVHNDPLFPLFRGLPVLADNPCPPDCRICSAVCPTGAISHEPLQLDMGQCVFCSRCQLKCPSGLIRFTGDRHITVTSREQLLIRGGGQPVRPEQASEAIRSMFRRSLKLRQVSAGGCNGCELELNAASNVNFDMGRYGIEFVASPRHADGIVITGPITRNMAAALEDCYEAVPHPKIIILYGACAISGGIFKDSAALNREFLSLHKTDLLVPGCPPHPLTFITGLLNWLDRKG